MKSTLLLLAITLLAQTLYAGEKDSLMQALSTRLPDSTRINVYNQLSYLLAEDDEVRAKDFALKARQLSSEKNYPFGFIKSLYNLASLEEMASRYSEGAALYLQGIATAKQDNLPALVAYGYQDYALLLKKQGLHRQALRYNDSALTIYSALKDSARMAALFTNIGNNYKNLNLFEKAIDFQLKALAYAQAHNNFKGTARAYNNIGLIYERNGNQEKALECYLNMLEPARNSGDKRTLIVCLGNIGAAYQNLHQPAQALRFLDEAKNLNEAAGHWKDELYNLTNIASALNELRRYREALATGRQAEQMAKEAKDEESLGYALAQQGIALEGLSNYALAERQLLGALQTGKRIESNPLVMLTEEALTRLYERSNRPGLAMDHLKILTALKDSVYNTERHEQVLSLQTQYETEQKDRELAEKTAAVSENRLLLEKKNKLLYGSGLAIVALAIIGALALRNNKLKRIKMKQEADLSKAKALRRLHEEKLRISRELHDNIGAQLTFINSSLQSLSLRQNDLPTLKETQKLTMNTIRELRNTVWLINKAEFSVEEFVAKLHDYLRPAGGESTAVSIHLSGEGTRRMDGAVASHLFRVIQEAVNNALKHAGASEIDVKLAAGPRQLSVSIEDNGRGFDLNTTSQGNGLQNMRLRVEETGGQFNLYSAPDKGTRVEFSVPIQEYA